MKPPVHELKSVAIEFGFRYTKKDVRWKIEKMCVAIWNNRRIIIKQQGREQGYKDRIRELEMEVSDLDFKLRG